MSTLETDAPREVRMRWKGRHSDALLDTTTYETCIEGAIRAGKTTLCLWREFNALQANPGMHTMLARWTDKGVYGLVLPLWRHICDRAGVRLEWNPHEEYDELPNGSRAYVRGLKSQDQTLRYSKFRGLTLSRAYIDQAEEVPEDVYLEVTGRLSQSGFSHQMTISPQSVEEGFWIAKRFSEKQNSADRVYIPLSVYDNAHNLPPGYVERLVSIYPPEHPKHKTLILGKRGVNVTGEPVYKGAFLRVLHEGAAEFDPKLPLEMALDFGKHHPCGVFRQRSPHGQIRFLGGVLGQDLYLDDFLEVLLRYRSEWFPNPVEYLDCCDPAGASDTSHGTEGAVKTLRQRNILPRFVADSNSPAVRLAMVERMASHMRKRAANREEMLIVSSSERWLRVSSNSVVIDRFVADAFEAGYVWDEHMVSVGNKQVRKPKKDGWYEHGMNCCEYLELNFGSELPKPKKVQLEPMAMPTNWQSL